MPTHDHRPPDEPVEPAGPGPRAAPGALRGRGGGPLGVEPVPGGQPADAADDGTARRARLLTAHAWRWVPPPIG